MDENTLNALLGKAQQYGASDILLKVGQPPAFRVLGDLHYLQSDALKPEHTLAFAKVILKKTRQEKPIDEILEFDTSYAAKDIGRFRVNVYRQRSSVAIAMRAIPVKIPTIEGLLLPESVQDGRDVLGVDA